MSKQEIVLLFIASMCACYVFVEMIKEPSQPAIVNVLVIGFLCSSIVILIRVLEALKGKGE